MLYKLGRHPFLQTRVCEMRISSRFNSSRWTLKRFTSTSAHDGGELANESDSRRHSGRIHILGVGNVGGFIAHALASRPSPPPITLLLQDSNIYWQWIEKKQAIAVHSDGLDSIKSGFDISVLNEKIWYSVPAWSGNKSEEEGYSFLAQRSQDTKVSQVFSELVEDDSHIDCLIVTCKAPQTVKAVTSVKHRLSPDSTILFLQNGMGVFDEVNSKVFPFPETRPHYVSGVFSHGLARKGPFHVDHKAIGTTLLSPVSQSGALISQVNEQSTDWEPTTKYLLHTLNLTQQLVATTETPVALLQYQFEKLAMNAVINSMTALLDCVNGELLYNYSLTRVMRMILMEVSTVICALPELKDIPGIEDRFSAERLRRITVLLANKTGCNTSSMLQDMQYRRMLEVHYINGYIVRRGEELGIKCALNYMIMHLLLGKRSVLRQRESGAIPIDLSGP